MSCWIFKVSDQRLYADIEGVQYEYDNRHSIRVRAGDRFVYLDKRAGEYRFTGAGTVARVEERSPTDEERRRGKVRAVFTAVLGDVSWFEPPIDISRSKTGQRNRGVIGVSDDVNVMGWSISMPAITPEQYDAILAEGLAGVPEFSAERATARTLGKASWAPPSDDLMLAIAKADAPRGLADSTSPATRRSRDAADVGLAAEQIVHDLLAGGELRKIGGSDLRWPSRCGEQPGWDIEYKDQDGSRHGVEVKGTTGIRLASIELTENEWRAASALRERFWLYLVVDCWGRHPLVQRIQDPLGLVEKGALLATPAVWRIQRNGRSTATGSGASP